MMFADIGRKADNSKSQQRRLTKKVTKDFQSCVGELTSACIGVIFEILTNPVVEIIAAFTNAVQAQSII